MEAFFRNSYMWITWRQRDGDLNFALFSLQALRIAENEFGVTPLFSAEDMVECEVVDSLSIYTYVSEVITQSIAYIQFHNEITSLFQKEGINFVEVYTLAMYNTFTRLAASSLIIFLIK